MEKNIKVFIMILGIILLFIGLSNIISFIVSMGYRHINLLAAVSVVVYLISGIGILFLKLWAKWAAIMYAAFRIVQTPIQTFAWVYKTGGWNKVEIGSTIFTMLIVVILNLLVVYFLTRPKVKEQFK